MNKERLNKIPNHIETKKRLKFLTPARKKTLIAYSFILPNFIGFACLSLIPILFSFILSFLQWDGNNPIVFVGLENFIGLFSSSRFLNSLKNTIYYCILTVPFTLLFSFIIAVLINQKIKGRNLFRAVLFFPYVASLVALTAVWNMLFSPQKTGPINYILFSLGVSLENLPKWAADPNWVMITIVLFSIWKNVGYYMIIYLAGLQGINKELYEAGELDGCNIIQKIRYITIPQLRSTTFFIVIILTINCFKVYDIVYMLAGGANGVVSQSAIVLVYYIYEEAFRNWKLGYSSAVAVVLFIIVMIFTLFQFQQEKKHSN